MVQTPTACSFLVKNYEASMPFMVLTFSAKLPHARCCSWDYVFFCIPVSPSKSHSLRTRSITQQAKCWPCKLKDPSVVPQNPHLKSQVLCWGNSSAVKVFAKQVLEGRSSDGQNPCQSWVGEMMALCNSSLRRQRQGTQSRPASKTSHTGEAEE